MSEAIAAGHNGRTQELGDAANTEQAEVEKSKITTTKMNVVLFMMLFIDLLGFTVILPLMPKLLEYYGSEEGTDGLYLLMQRSVTGFRDLVGAPNTPKWNSVLFGGFIGSLFSLLQFIASPFIGAASDVYGRRPMMLITMIGVAFSYILWALANNFTIFVIARIVGGLAKGNVSLSTAVVADVYGKADRGKGMALIGISFSMGFLLGPMIGAGFAGGSVKFIGGGQFFVGPALYALFMAALDVIYIFLAFPETLPSNKRAASLSSATANVFRLINPISLFNFSAVTGLTKSDQSSMRRIGVVYFLYMFLYSGLEFTLTFLTYLRFGYSSMQQGKMFFTMGVVMVLVQGGYTRRLPAGTEVRTAITGVFLLIPAFISIGYARTSIAFYSGLILFAFASATVVPCMTTLISGFGTESQKGAVMGVFRSLGALARAFGPVFASAAYWSLGAERAYLAGAVFLLIPLFGMFSLKSINVAHKRS